MGSWVACYGGEWHTKVGGSTLTFLIHWERRVERSRKGSTKRRKVNGNASNKTGHSAQPTMGTRVGWLTFIASAFEKDVQWRAISV